MHLPSVGIEVNVADRLHHSVPTHQDTLSVLLVTVIQKVHTYKVYRVYDVDKIGVGRVETDEARHSLEQQLSRVKARNPAKTLFVSRKISLEVQGALKISTTSPSNPFSPPEW